MADLALTDGRTLETLDTIDDLRAVVGTPGSLAVRKDIARIDDNFAGYIQKSPFALLGTASSDGLCDVSPRGDRPGFVRVLDETHIALPERPGNKRADSLSNIIETRRAGLLFLIPGMGETLRVNGTAGLTKDAALLESMAIDGKPAVLAIVVTVQEAYIHCPKAFLRSQLWDTDAWPSDRPSMACIVQNQLSLEHVPLEAIEASIAEDNKHLWQRFAAEAVELALTRRRAQERTVREQPQVQYATAPDGVRIAYWTVGEGVPLISISPMPYSNIQREWGFDPQRGYYESLIQSDIQLVRYDCRGAGLSDREVTDYTLEAHARDLEAVADRLGLRQFALQASGHSGGVAVHFAAHHPERVSHLITWLCYPRAAEYGAAPRVKAHEALMEQDWGFWTRAEAFRVSEYEGGETSNWVVQYIRESLTEEGSKAAVAELRKFNVTPLLMRVLAPTLVLHRAGVRPITVDMAKELAATIPNARLMLLPGSWVMPFFGGGTDEILAAIRNLVLETPPGPIDPMATERHDVSPSVLTARETEILALIARGRTSREVAEALALSVRTVGRHITNVYAKIGARTRADATTYAIRHRIA